MFWNRKPKPARGPLAEDIVIGGYYESNQGTVYRAARVEDRRVQLIRVQEGQAVGPIVDSTLRGLTHEPWDFVRRVSIESITAPACYRAVIQTAEEQPVEFNGLTTEDVQSLAEQLKLNERYPRDAKGFILCVKKDDRVHAFVHVGKGYRRTVILPVPAHVTYKVIPYAG